MLTKRHISLLNAPFTKMEIDNVVFYMKANSAPGPDRMPALFYQKCWGIFASDTTRMVMSFLNRGYLARELVHTIIILIPKAKSPSKFCDYRPISLCNVLYKIISKTLVNRLKLIFLEVISPFQNASVKDRDISDNILIAGVILHHFWKKKRQKSTRKL